MDKATTGDRIRLNWLADTKAMSECLDRLGVPDASYGQSLDYQSAPTSPAPSLAFRLAWLEGHVRALRDHPIYVVKAAPEDERRSTTHYAEVVRSVLDALVEVDGWPTIATAERWRDSSSGPFVEAYGALVEWLRAREAKS